MEKLSAIRQTALEFGRWLPVAAIVGVVAGTGSALLLHSLEWATRVRETTWWVVFTLPLLGAMSTWVYLRWGGRSASGNTALFEELNAPRARLPLRMAPLIFIATVIAHLGGASVGREGTAVQIAAPLADQLTRWGWWTPRHRQILLTSAVSAGFASVFGTPLAGMIFGLEVRRVGVARYDALLPCVVAAFSGNAVTSLWGISHLHVALASVPPLGLENGLFAGMAGVVFGLTAYAFTYATRRGSAVCDKAIPNPVVRTGAAGGALLVAVAIVGSTRFLGLGLPMLTDAFNRPISIYDVVMKFGFTTLSIGGGFRGGEVTPLFVIGATLGNVLSGVVPLEVHLLAAMGFVAVFAGASNCPLTSIVAGIEIFGTETIPFVAIGCVVSYFCSGHRGMYSHQPIEVRKYDGSVADDPPQVR